MSVSKNFKNTSEFQKKTTNFFDVVEFNQSFGVTINTEEQHNIFKDNPKLVNLRFSLINEEVTELNDAFTQKDFVEVIDALTDILYVVYGAGASFGIDLDFTFSNYCLDTYQSCDFNVTNFQKVKQINSEFVSDSIKKNIFIPSKNKFLTNIRLNYLKDINFYKKVGEQMLADFFHFILKRNIPAF